MVGGIDQTDFENSALKDFGRTVSRTTITRTTDNVTGRETLTKGSAADITAHVSIRDVTWTQDEIAFLQGADGYIMVKHDVTLNEHDYITFDGLTYEIEKIITMKASALSMFKYALLLLKE